MTTRTSTARARVEESERRRRSENGASERRERASGAEWAAERAPASDAAGESEGRSPSAKDQACDTFERNFILRALEKSDWNVTATARYLGIPLSTLKHKMARLDLRDLARKLRGA